MAYDRSREPQVRDLEHFEPFLISAIQPVGSGTEVRLADDQRRAGLAVAPQHSTLTSGGVPWELVGRFLGRRSTRRELEAERVRFRDDGRIAYHWQGQVYFLAV